MKEKISFIVSLICIISPAVCTIITVIGSILNAEAQAWYWATIILALLTMVFSLAGVFINRKQSLKLIKQHEEQSAKLSALEKFVCDGRKILRNDAYINFDVHNKLYKIKIVKKFKLLDFEKRFYVIRLYCDKFLGDKERSKTFYNQNPVEWDNIGLEIRMVVHHQNGKIDTYENINFTEIERISNNYFFLKIECAVKLDSGQISKIDLYADDEIDLSYSFNISTKYWGNYIERRFSYFREETNVYLEKVPHLNPNDINITYVNTHGTIRQVAPSAYNVENLDLYYKFSLPVQHEDLQDSKDSLYRIMWDANAIFGANDLNTPNAEQLGISAVLKGSD